MEAAPEVVILISVCSSVVVAVLMLVVVLGFLRIAVHMFQSLRISLRGLVRAEACAADGGHR